MPDRAWHKVAVNGGVSVNKTRIVLLGVLTVLIVIAVVQFATT